VPATIAVLGMTSNSPFAGVAWQTLHYLEGLRRLGHDVYYVEDHAYWPYDGALDTICDDSSWAVAYVEALAGRVGLAERWAYVDVTRNGHVHGMGASALADLYTGADVLLNLSGSTVLRDEHLAPPVRIYLETDPVLPQIEVAQGRQFTIDLLSAHTHHFTYGENLGAADCRVPTGRFRYRPTRQPVILDWWMGPDGRAPDAVFTTVANWKQTYKDVELDGERYTWSKDAEFRRFIDLPEKLGRALELALATRDGDTIALLRSHGWRVRDGMALSKSLDDYRGYIAGSDGEFTVAKDQNVRLRSGWFSDRSACYLAAGRPVVTQDTGFGNVLPVGAGLFAFRTMDDILAAFAAIDDDPGAHRAAARGIAEEHFRAETVLAALLAEAGV
jgi:hypothetical protein